MIGRPIDERAVSMLLFASGDAEAVRPHVDNPAWFPLSMPAKHALLKALAHARLVTIDGVERGPDPASPPPWSVTRDHVVMTWDADDNEAFTCELVDNYDAIVHRVNAWDAALGRIAALEADLTEAREMAVYHYDYDPDCHDFHERPSDEATIERYREELAK